MKLYKTRIYSYVYHTNIQCMHIYTIYYVRIYAHIYYMLRTMELVFSPWRKASFCQCVLKWLWVWTLIKRRNCHKCIACNIRRRNYRHKQLWGNRKPFKSECEMTTQMNIFKYIQIYQKLDTNKCPNIYIHIKFLHKRMSG